MVQRELTGGIRVLKEDECKEFKKHPVTLRPFLILSNFSGAEVIFIDSCKIKKRNLQGIQKNDSPAFFSPAVYP